MTLTTGVVSNGWDTGKEGSSSYSGAISGAIPGDNPSSSWVALLKAAMKPPITRRTIRIGMTTKSIRRINRIIVSPLTTRQ